MTLIDVNEDDLMDTGKFRRDVLDALKKACQASEDAKLAAMNAAEKVDTVKRMAEQGHQKHDERQTKLAKAANRVWRAIVAAVGDLEK